MYFLVLFVLVVAIGAITSGIIISHNSFESLSRRFTALPLFMHRGRSVVPAMPIITREGEVIESVDQLDAHLQALNEKLQSKVHILSENKCRCLSTQDKINKLDVTQYEVKKYYNQLKKEIGRNEGECADLQFQINDYLKRREDLKRELLSNPYSHISNVAQGSTSNDGNNQAPEEEIIYDEVERWIHEFKTKYGNQVAKIPDEELKAQFAAKMQAMDNQAILDTGLINPNEKLSPGHERRKPALYEDNSSSESSGTLKEMQQETCITSVSYGAELDDDASNKSFLTQISSVFVNLIWRRNSSDVSEADGIRPNENETNRNKLRKALIGGGINEGVRGFKDVEILFGNQNM